MAAPRRPAPVKEVDLEQTAELPVIDFSGVHADLSSSDATISVAALSLDDTLSRTDTYAVPSLNSAAGLADNLRDVEERLHRKAERAAALERELDVLRAAEQEQRAALEARITEVQAQALRDVNSARSTADEQLATLRSAHESALTAARAATTESARQLAILNGRHEEVTGRLAGLETRLGQHIATLSSQEKELAQRARRIDELQAELVKSSSLVRELGQARDALAQRADTLDVQLKERTETLAARVTELQSASSRLSQSEAVQARLQSERDELHGCSERQLEALHRLEGYRGVAEALIGDREAELAQRDAEVTDLRTQLLQLAERDERIATLESQLLTARGRLSEQDQRVDSLSTDGRALEGRLKELNEALASADRGAMAQSEALRVAAQHSAEIEVQLATEREQTGRLGRDLDSARTAAAAELARARADAAGALERERVEAAGALAAERAATATEREQLQQGAAAERDRLQSQAATDLAAVAQARDALVSQLAEREAELRTLAEAQQKATTDVAQRELAITEREQAVTELLDDQQEQLARQKSELQAVQEASRRVEGDLHAAEEQLRHFEAEQRHRETRVAELTSSSESLQSRLNEALARLAEREDQLRRLETEAHASNAVLGKLQQSIQRLSREDTGSRPVVVEPPLESMARLLVRVDGGTEHSFTVGRRTTLGRTPDNDIRLDANFVSRHHAVILASNKNTIIEDLNSTNGVVVNGRRVARQPLQHGDVVSIGTAEFRFELRPMGHAGAQTS